MAWVWLARTAWVDGRRENHHGPSKVWGVPNNSLETKWGWFLERCRGHGLLEFLEAGRIDLPACCVVGLVKVRPGLLPTTLRPLQTPESRLLHAFYGLRKDFHTVYVEDMYSLGNSSFSAIAKVAQKHGKHHAASKVAFIDQIFHPFDLQGAENWIVLDCYGHETRLGDLLGPDAASTAAAMLALCVPGPVAQLTLDRQWCELPVLAACYPYAHIQQRRRFDERLQRLCDEWPSADWVWDAVAAVRNKLAEPEPAPIDVDWCASLAAELRRWAPTIIRAAVSQGDAELAAGEQALLESAVQMLDHGTDVLRGGLGSKPRKMKTYKSNFLLAVFRASELLRNRSKFKNLFDAVRRCIPGFVIPLDAVPSPSRSTLWRLRFLVDVALILQTKSANQRMAENNSVVIRYGLADSSPQIHRDWLILHYKAVKGGDLLDTWEAVQLLDMDAEIRANNLFRSRERLRKHRRGDFDLQELEEDDAVDRPPPLTDDKRKALNKILETNIMPHTCIPVAVGAGHRSLPHKV